MELATAMLFWLGIVFELPIVMMLLAKLRLVSHRGFIKVRKYVPVAAWILACIITPTFDVVNMFLVFMPLIILYEVGVFLAWLVRPRIEGRGREA
jgi:sec-independent protein translocase protein TatC